MNVINTCTISAFKKNVKMLMHDEGMLLEQAVVEAKRYLENACANEKKPVPSERGIKS